MTHDISILAGRGPPLIDRKGWRTRWIGSIPYWSCQIGGWGLCVANRVVAMLAMPKPEDQKSQIILTALWAGLGVVCSHLLRVVFVGFKYRELRWLALASRVIPAIALLSLAMTGAFSLVCVLAPGNAATENEVLSDYLFILSTNGFILSAWSALYLGWGFYGRFQTAMVEKLQIDTAAKDAELRALKSQINPHFLFNSLNSIRALIPRDCSRPREAITRLSELLHATLAINQKTTVTLAYELETVRNYLAMEQMRFEERLVVNYVIAPEALKFLLPPMMLQTLIENAVKFGVGLHEDPTLIAVEAKVELNGLVGLVLRVTNRGTIRPSQSSTGIGLSNARARLRLLFGEAASLTLRATDGGMVIAEAYVPVLPAVGMSRP